MRIKRNTRHWPSRIAPAILSSHVLSFLAHRFCNTIDHDWKFAPSLQLDITSDIGQTWHVSYSKRNRIESTKLTNWLRILCTGRSAYNYLSLRPKQYSHTHTGRQSANTMSNDIDDSILHIVWRATHFHAKVGSAHTARIVFVLIASILFIMLVCHPSNPTHACVLFTEYSSAMCKAYIFMRIGKKHSYDLYANMCAKCKVCTYVGVH